MAWGGYIENPGIRGKIAYARARAPSEAGRSIPDLLWLRRCRATVLPRRCGVSQPTSDALAEPVGARVLAVWQRETPKAAWSFKPRAAEAMETLVKALSRVLDPP